MLYLIATPIGNLSDITFRAIETLKSCDYILCEDTRHSQTLLNHYDIKKPLKSYHQFNEASSVEAIIQDLKEGKSIALISDAGTPGISDPGAILVKQCVLHDVPFTAIPGPCAAIQAVACSGFSTDQFQFWGFLARKEGELKDALQTILMYPGTTICYESPQRLLHTLRQLAAIAPDRPLAVARELTKKFEEILRGTASELLNQWEGKEVKGEIVLLIAPNSQPANDWADWTPLEHVERLEKDYGLSRKEAIKLAAELRGVPKRDVYEKVAIKPAPEFSS